MGIDDTPTVLAPASPDGRKLGRWNEIGTLGLEAMGSFIHAAYHAELQWPGCYPLYSRLRRADPEVAIVRQIFSAVTSRVRLEFRRPQTDIAETDDDKRALEFAQSALADLEGGPENFLETMVAQVPFMGWGFWEAVPGVRRRNWRPPDGDEWRSENDDGLVGFRRLAWRDHSSFVQWDLDERTGRLRGLVQQDYPNPQVTIPIGRAVHVTFGDSDNPEGLTPLEALWRLERIKYGLEVVQGIGYEHAAGYLDVKKTSAGEMTDTDRTNIKKAARAVLTAQEGNYVAWPNGFEGEIKDVPFGAAPTLLEAIRYYGLLKLTLFNMQWVGMSVISGTGSFAALKDSSAMWLVAYNAMLAGFARQTDRQFGKRLFAHNAAAFPGMTLRPQLVVTEVDKTIDLQELSQFWTAIKGTMPLGEDDYLAFRRKSGFLPEALPEEVTDEEPETPDDTDQVDDAEDDAEDALDAEAAPTEQELAARRELYERFRRPALAELSLADLQQDFTGISQAHRATVYDAVLAYLVQDGTGSRGFKGAMKRSVVEGFPEVFYAGYGAGGGEDVEPEDDRWLTARMNAELGFIDLLFGQLKGLKDEAPAPAELVDEANRRADGYADTLRAVFAEGLLRGQKNVMLTMVGQDGEKSCRDCRRHVGKRYSARKWLRIGIPGVPGNGFECGGWECRHGLQDDRGTRWTL